MLDITGYGNATAVMPRLLRQYPQGCKKFKKRCRCNGEYSRGNAAMLGFNIGGNTAGLIN